MNYLHNTNCHEPSHDVIESYIEQVFKFLSEIDVDCSPTKYKIRGANRLLQQLFCRYTPLWLERLVFLLTLILTYFIQSDKKPKHSIKKINPNNEPIFLVARLSSPLFNEIEENPCLILSVANTLQALVNLRKAQWML